MSKTVFFIDNVLNDPHGPLYIEKNKQRNGTWSVENMLGHFQDFPIDNLYNLKHIDLFQKDDIKYLITFAHMPETNVPYLSREAINLLCERKNLFLIIVSPLEYIIKPRELYLGLSKKTIPLEKVIVLCSNFEAHNKTYEGIKYLCINFWESYSRKHLKVLPGASIILPEHRRNSLDHANKKFICLNRNIKPHRIWFYYSIMKTEILKQGHVSYHLPSIDRFEYEKVSMHDWVLKRIPQELHGDYMRTVRRKMHERTLDVLDTRNVINYTDTTAAFYHDSLVSFVTESETNTNFITEKTYKAIANLHPFFIVGNPDQHTILRARGYHTFEELFGVNQITNYREAHECLEKLKSIDLQVLKDTIKEKYFDKLVHNQQNLLNRKISWQTIVDEIEKSFKGIS
jgi:hypothetical protein